MPISSTEELSKELVGILSARTIDELIQSMGENHEYWKSVFLIIGKYRFDHLYKYHSFSHTSTYSYISLKAALGLIPNFANGSKAYGAPDKQELKFKQLLMALSFLDSDLFVTLILKRFRWDLVETLLSGDTHVENE